MQQSFSLVPSHLFAEQERRAIYRAIFTRRDVRSQFLPQPVSDATLARLLLAGHHAPSVGFMQPWSFLLIRDPDVKRCVSVLFDRANTEAAQMFDDGHRATYMRLKLQGIVDAPVNLCITCDRDRAGKVVIGRTHMPETDLYSTVCAVQNIWLAARSEGIGVGWVSIFRESELKSLLGIPTNQVVIAYLCLGHVDTLHAAPELATAGWRHRLDLASLIHFDKWQQREENNYLEATIADERRRFISDGCFDP